MGNTGNVRSSSRARRSRRELHERYVIVDRRSSRRISSDAPECNESSTVCRPEPQEESPPGAQQRVTGVPDTEHEYASGDSKHELEMFPCSVQLDYRLSVCVSEETEDVTLGDAVFTNIDLEHGNQIVESSAESSDGREFGDECIQQSHAEAIGDLTNSERTKNYSMLSRVSRARSEPLLKWQSVLAVLLSCGTSRFTVEQYETLRCTLIWQSSHLGGTQEALPGFRKIQRSLVPLMCEFSYAKSKVEQFRKRFNRTGQARVVLPSEWAIMDTSTGPLYEAMFCGDMRRKAVSGPGFIFEDIENSPVVVSRRKAIATSQCIFTDVKQEETSAHMSRLPVVAESGDSIEVTFQSTKSSDTILGTKGAQPSNRSNEVVSFKICRVWQHKSNVPSMLHGLYSKETLFHKCTSLKGGDTIVELQRETCFLDDKQTGYSYLLVYRFRRHVPGEPTKQLVFVPRRALIDGELTMALCTVCAVRGVTCNSTPALPDARQQHAPCSGYLHDGRRYVVYRVLLYCDEFQPYNSKSGSFGGCYMLPMGIPSSQRSGYGAVRYIGLTPPQVSSNEIIHHIIPDIVKCSTTGVTGTDPWGNPVTIFIDVLGYIGDYPAVTHALDLLGHNSRAPCHLCSFIRQDRIGPTDLPYYGYTTSVHSRTTSFCRSIDRMRILRDENTAIQDLNTLGFQPIFDVTGNPLHALSRALEEARNLVPLTSGGAPVVPALFDPYRSSVVAPDHLLFGLAQDVLRATLSHFSPIARKISDYLITKSLRSNDLGNHRQVINVSSASINSMGMSEMFAVLLVAPTSLESALAIAKKDLKSYQSDTSCESKMTRRLSKKRRTGSVHTLPISRSSENRGSSPVQGSAIQSVRDVDMLGLLYMFQQLVNETHFWPDAALDGAATVHEFNERRGEERMDMLYGSAVHYIQKLHDICVRDKDVAGKYLNKPNVHRLIELFTHTIPLFGHCRHVQELLFETAHQPLKRAITRSNQRDPHISAVTATLANDWEARLSIEVSRLGEPQSWTPEQCMRLHRLICGRDVEGPPDIQRIRAIFCKPVLSQLAKVRNKLSSFSRDGMIWKAEFQEVGNKDGFESWRVLDFETRAMFDRAIDRIRASNLCNRFDPISLRVAEYASSWNIQLVDKGGTQNLTELRRRFGFIYPGSVVQALVAETSAVFGGEDEYVLELPTPRTEDDMHSVNFSVSFWLVLGVFDVSSFSASSSHPSGQSTRTSYAFVLPCIQENVSENLPAPLRVQSTSKAYVLALSQSVQNVMCIHACRYTNNCILNDQDCVQHSGFVCSGTPFYAFGRKEGYPPRTG